VSGYLWIKEHGPGARGERKIALYAENSKKVFYDHQKSKFDVIGVIDVISICFQ
jgi:hypothetical protein